MRCENCGWQNQGGVQRCVKCNHVLPQNEGKALEPVKPLKKTSEGNATDFIKRDPWDMPGTGELKDLLAKMDKERDSSESERIVQNREEISNHTFDPSRKKQYKHSFSLIPVKKDGEGEIQDLRFEGDTLDLYRSNLDPGNMSITSKTQAVIECVNGQWYLMDKSELQTTFILVHQPVALSSGDIILMGNRKFVFQDDDN